MNKLKDTIIVVSGLPRSGTSMMMQILEAMDISLFTDNKRIVDESNPKGYFEHKAVQNLEKDSAWLKSAKGKAVKIISHLLLYLPDEYLYKIIFMKRNLDEIIHSQNKMLSLNDPNYSATNPDIIKNLFEKNLEQVENWATKKPNIEILYLQYAEIIANPANEIEKVSKFLGVKINVKKISIIVDVDSYHNPLTMSDIQNDE